MAAGYIDRTTLEASTEGVQVISKAFLRTILREAGETGWYVDVTNDTNVFARPDKDVQGFVFGPGGIDQDAYTPDVAFTRLGSESYGYMNYPGLTYYTDLRVRNIESTEVPMANVKAWGALGDGSTNDRAKIVLAINALKAAGGGECYFPPGTYRMNTGISIADLKGVTIRGAGMTSTHLKLDDVVVRHFTFNRPENLTFRDLSFSRVGVISTAGIGGVNLTSGSLSYNVGHRFENVHFQGLSDAAIEIDLPRGLVMNNVFVDRHSDSSAVDLTTPFSTSINSLVMTYCDQRGLYVHGNGRDVSVNASRAFHCGIGFEVDECVAVFNACTAEEGDNNSATYPGYGFVAGDTYSQVTLMNTSVVSAAGITAYVETGGAVFAKFNALQLMAGVTTTEMVSPGATAVFAGSVTIDDEILIKQASSPGETAFRTVADDGYASILAGLVTSWGGVASIGLHYPGGTLTAPVMAMSKEAQAVNGTPGVGFGVRTRYQMYAANSDHEVSAYEDVVWSDVTTSAEDADWVWYLMEGGAAPAERMRLTSAGILSAVGLVASGYLSTGTTPSSAGAIRVPFAGAVVSRNSADSGDVSLISLTASNRITFGTTRTGAGTPGNFSADYYIIFKDGAGNSFVVPAMNAAW